MNITSSIQELRLINENLEAKVKSLESELYTAESRLAAQLMKHLEEKGRYKQEINQLSFTIQEALRKIQV